MFEFDELDQAEDRQAEDLKRIDVEAQERKRLREETQRKLHDWSPISSPRSPRSPREIRTEAALLISSPRSPHDIRTEVTAPTPPAVVTPLPKTQVPAICIATPRSQGGDTEYSARSHATQANTFSSFDTMGSYTRQGSYSRSVATPRSQGGDVENSARSSAKEADTFSPPDTVGAYSRSIATPRSQGGDVENSARSSAKEADTFSPPDTKGAYSMSIATPRSQGGDVENSAGSNSKEADTFSPPDAKGAIQGGDVENSARSNSKEADTFSPPNTKGTIQGGDVENSACSSATEVAAPRHPAVEALLPELPEPEKALLRELPGPEKELTKVQKNPAAVPLLGESGPTKLQRETIQHLRRSNTILTFLAIVLVLAVVVPAAMWCKTSPSLQQITGLHKAIAGQSKFLDTYRHRLDSEHSQRIKDISTLETRQDSEESALAAWTAAIKQSMATESADRARAIAALPNVKQLMDAVTSERASQTATSNELVDKEVADYAKDFPKGIASVKKHLGNVSSQREHATAAVTPTVDAFTKNITWYQALPPVHQLVNAESSNRAKAILAVNDSVSSWTNFEDSITFVDNVENQVRDGVCTYCLTCGGKWPMAFGGIAAKLHGVQRRAEHCEDGLSSFPAGEEKFNVCCKMV